MTYGLYYDYKKVGDVLIIQFDGILESDHEKRIGNIVSLFNGDKLLSIRIYEISKIIKIKAKGYIPFINEKVLDVINTILINAGLDPLEPLATSSYIVSRIEEVEEHPTNKSYKVCKVNYGDSVLLQVVSNAENIRENLLCVCALPFAFLSDRTQVVPQSVDGVNSLGLICTPKDLQLRIPDSENKVFELDEAYSVGEDFWKY